MGERRVPDVWEQGEAYERYVGRWSRQVAPLFLQSLKAQAGRRWVDVGCGTGALCAAILDHCSPSSVIGVEPSEGFLKTARDNLGERAVLLQGSATAIPLADSSVDLVVSGLVLNFVPDQRAALVEMLRVTRSGGVIAAYVWDYADKMELMRYFWDSAAEVDPHASTLDESSRFPLCRPEALTELFTHVGLGDVEVKAIEIDTPFASFEEYWQPFLGGQGAAPAYAMSLDEAMRARVRERIRELIPTEEDGSISLIARAWAIRATR
ncbi:MAG: methyltransferase domain-containing protein [Pseudomonadota bacterium]